MNLEKLSELLCFQCGKLYESITKPDDEAILVPVLGACLHSICILCATGLESPNSCPICENPEAFGNIISNCTALQNHQLIKNKLEKDFEGSGTKIRNCSSCKEVSENLQFCITCAQSQDILKQPSNNGKWIAVPLRKDLSIICLSCGVLEHKEHELAPIDMLENLEDIALLLTISSFISHSKTGLEEIVEYFENVEIQIFNCKEGFKNWRTPEFHECQLDSYKKNFVSEIEEMTKEKVKLRRRKFEFQEKRAEDIIFSLEKALIQYSGQPEASCRLRFALEKLKGLTENFSENFTTLDPEEILRIDSEINRRMHELEHSEREKSFIKSEEVGGFFKYRAIAQEIQDSEAELKNLKSQRDDLSRSSPNETVWHHVQIPNETHDSSAFP
ncbi:RING-type domain-containing protein [Caenorhabditis elegans]|uniref:RING-type domain-containing protein n=1 Tax=Caenorhabditis elegans TaxID=6239 RepID=A0A4V0IIL0_CAEEL|nr:RING-type domain-containing protein [Caenorhabditis elegans]VTW47223.1 RING-type domain-containing protein [Caenorhabditis elegans]